MVVRVVPALLLVACASAGNGEIIPPDSGKPPSDAPIPLPQDSQPPADAMEPDSMTQNLCASAATCQTAIALGAVSGDTSNVKLNTSGHQSAWFRVRVTEDDSDIFGLSLRFGAKLTSPATNDYDVIVYVNEGSDVVECATTTGTTTTAGTVNETLAEWGEGTVSNGSSDSRNVSVEIRPVGGNCSAANPWTLEVQGNWL